MHPRAAELIDTLQLSPHPEGGHFRRTYASAARVSLGGAERPAMTAIRFLLVRGQVGLWHRIDADECWHWLEGDALELLQFDGKTESLSRTILDASGTPGATSLQIVPASVWQAARPLGDYALVACTVAPGFAWQGFELMPPECATAARLRREGAWSLATG